MAQDELVTISLMRRPSYQVFLHLIAGLLLALFAALLFEAWHSPLPWMLGPLFATATARLLNAPFNCPWQIRAAGQWAIGTVLGLYFTPSVIAILVNRGSVIFIAVMFALLLGLVCAWLLARLSGIQRSTAFFCMAIGGASEMAAQAARHHARVDYVAAAHSLRLMLVVAIIPFALKFFDVHGQDAYEPATRIIQPLGLIVLIGLTTCAALVLQKLRWPNAWVIGPLLISIAITAANISLSALPTWMSHAGQLFIGFSLGTHFTPSFIRGAPRFMLSVAVCTIFALIVSAGFGWLLADCCDLHFATAILATAPGGIAEMSLTAKTLELGVPIVTAFHVSRMAVLVLTIGPLFRVLQKFLAPPH